MATESQYPDAIISATNLSGAVTAIDDDPDSPDASWLTAPGSNNATAVRVSFPTPSGTPNTGAGLQSFRVWVRKTNHSTDPTAVVELYETGGGAALATIVASTTITSTTGQLLTGTWNASLLGTASGAAVECRVAGTPGGGPPGNRASVEVGAIEWVVDYALAPSGVVASSVRPLTSALAGTHEQSGAIASAVQPLTSAASGTHTPPAPTGAVASTLAPLTSSAAGYMEPSGSAASTLAPLTAAASGGVFLDKLVNGSASGITDTAFSMHGPYWADENTGVIIFSNSSFHVAATKTTDGGATWGTPSVVEAGSAQVAPIAAWFDRETPGDAGDQVHVVWADLEDDEFKYAAYDISAGSWSGLTTIVSTGIAVTAAARAFITKTRAGGFVAGYGQGATGSGCFTSADGATWSSVANAWESDGDYWTGLSANTGDDNDAAILFLDAGSNEISVKVYDDSADSWTETSVDASVSSSSQRRAWGRSTRLSDGHAIVAFWNAFDVATADLKAYDLNINSVAAPGVTALTDVLAESGESACAAVFIDQTTDDLYVAYTRGSAVNATVSVFYKKSTDDGSTWGTETAMSEDAEDDIRLVSAGAMGTSQGGRFQPSWFNDDLSDIYVSLNNDVPIASGATTGTVASAVQPLTAALTGVMQPSGTVASALQPLTAAASGTQTQSGTVASALQPAVAAAAGTHEQTGTVASSLQPLTAAATGVMQPSGAVASSVQALTSASAGTQSQAGTVAASLPTLVSTASGYMHAAGTAAAALQPLTSSATGAVAQFVGSISSDLQPLTAAATGVMQPSGAVAAALQPLTSTSAGAHAQSGAVASSLAPLTSAATGVMQPSGSVSSTLQPLTSAAEGTTTAASATGTVASALQPLTSAATASQTQSGAIASSLAPATSALSGTHAQAGTIASTLQPLTSASAGTQSYTGTVGSTLAPLTAAATGSQPFTGAVAASLQPLTSAAAGGVTSGVTGTVGAVLQPLTSTSSGARLDVIYVVGQAVHAPVASGEARHAAVASGRAQHAATAGVEARHAAIASGKAVHDPTAAEEAVHG